MDRSGAYIARWIAKSLVYSGFAKRIMIEISYAIGKVDPISVSVDTYGTSKYSSDFIIKKIFLNFDLRPGIIIE